MDSEQQTVLSSLKQVMKASPVSAPSETRQQQRKMMDGYVRMTSEQPVRMDPAAAKRRKKIISTVVIVLVVLGIAALVALKTGILKR